MFAHLSYSSNIQANALVPVTVAVPGGSFIDINGGALYLVIQVLNRTAGNVDVIPTGSGTGVAGSFFEMGNDLNRMALAADGMYYTELSRDIPRFLEILLDPHGGFDGLVGLQLRSNRPVAAPPVS